jgi:hypothetical protein
MLLSGEVNDEEKQISKPCQLGAFVTAYSRRIMLTYMKAIDPTLKSCIFTYTDNDSLHITGENYKKLLALGYIKNKAEVKLGFLCSDIKGEGIITKEIDIAPKNYLYEYINNNGDKKENESAVMKCKGIMKKVLRADLYKEELTEELSFDSLKKKHKTLTNADVEKGVGHFSIVNCTQKRTFNKSSWKGMDFVNGEWFPKNYGK